MSRPSGRSSSPKVTSPPSRPSHSERQAARTDPYFEPPYIVVVIVEVSFGQRARTSRLDLFEAFTHALEGLARDRDGHQAARVLDLDIDGPIRPVPRQQGRQIGANGSGDLE